VTNKRGDLFPQFDFTGNWRLWFAVSGIIILIGLLSLFTRGLNVGIDFTGGSAVDLKFAERVTVAEVRDALADFGHGAAEILSSPEDPDLIILRTQTFSDEQEKEAIYEALRTRVGEFEELQSQHVMPVVSQELARNAMLAMLIAAAGILVYVSFRFEWRFGVAAILALVHDALVTLGLFSIFQLAVDMPFVAAILTIMGYSINATIVVFDRIRENLKYRKKERLGELANASISQTLMRCINTSATTLLVVRAVLLFGGRTIQSFMLALLIGVLAGTYSSIFLASPLWLMLRGEIGKMRTAKA
jgi:preprotein translocase subunit SecF